MRNGVKAAAAVLLLSAVGAGLLYAGLPAKKSAVRDCAEAYVVSMGYPAARIESISVEHSYLNRLLGYNEWRISVVFDKRPDVSFWMSYENHAILFAGVSIDPMPNDKELVIEYSEAFKNGTFLDM